MLDSLNRYLCRQQTCTGYRQRPLTIGFCIEYGGFLFFFFNLLALGTNYPVNEASNSISVWLRKWLLLLNDHMLALEEVDCFYWTHTGLNHMLHTVFKFSCQMKTCARARVKSEAKRS